MAPAGGEKNKDEGFVLLEETEAIEAKMQQQQQQQQSRLEGEAPVVEYELASFRRTLSSACEDDTVYSDEDENEVDLDDLSLEDMPTDLQGLCRRLRAQSLALAAEESKQANKGKEKGKGEGEAEEETSEKEQEERRRRRRERRQQERRRLQLKQAQEEGRGIHGFLRFAWPIGTRELLFWALLVVFMTTLVSLSGGQHTRAVVNTTVGRGGGGRGTCVMGGGREGGMIPTPLFVFDDVATAVAAAAAFQQHCPSSLPSYQQQGGTNEMHNLSPYTEIALLQGQLRAQVSLAEDREEELKWTRVQQQQLERKVEVLSKTVEGLQLELCLARRGGREGGKEGGEEVEVEKEGLLTLNVVPEVCTVKEGGREGMREGVWWWGANWNGYVARAREAVMSLKEGGSEGGVGYPTITILPGRFSVLGEEEGEEEEEQEEWWSDEETDDEWWSDEEDDSDWSDEEEDEDEDEDEDDFWWSDAEWEDEDEDEREEGEEVLPTSPPMSPFVKPVTAQWWDEMASGGREGGRGACHTACAAPHWFAASQKRGGRVEGMVETEGMCAVQSGWAFF